MSEETSINDPQSDLFGPGGDEARLVEKVRHFQVRRSEYPYASSLLPYVEMDKETIEAAIDDVRQIPELRSRLARSVRQCMGWTEVEYVATAVMEAHIDILEVPPALSSRLVSIGFHPDRFYKLYPEIYQDHYTLAFWVGDHRTARTRFLRQEFDRRVGLAIELVRESRIQAYIEAEYYTSKDVRRYLPFVPMPATAFANFPLTGRQFDLRSVSDSDASREASWLPADSAKAVDIHIKLPHRALLPAEQLTDGDKVLRERLVDLGFYEIISERGNSIYTAQFLKGRTGRRVFRDLESFFSQHVGISALTLETCTLFWRQAIGAAGALTYSPVPPIFVDRKPE